jgi:hypothetical protein
VDARVVKPAESVLYARISDQSVDIAKLNVRVFKKPAIWTEVIGVDPVLEDAKQLPFPISELSSKPYSALPGGERLA